MTNDEHPPLRLVSTATVDNAATTDDDASVERAARDYLARARAFAQQKRERWGDDSRQCMTRLVRRFPSLGDADGIEPWDATRFLRWACDADMTSGRLHAVRFILQVWNPSTDWTEVAAAQGLDGGHLTAFNVVDACAVWDESHRAGCLAYIELPFQP